MRPLPHKPKIALVPDMIQRVDRFFELNEPRREEEFENNNGEFYGSLADQYIVRAALDYVNEQAPGTILAHVRKGLTEMRTAYEIGHRTTPWEAWDFFLYALAAKDRSMAHFMSSLPDESWTDPGNATLAWLVAQTRAAHALFRHDELAADRQLEHLHAYVFEEEMPSGLQDDLPEIQNAFHLLQALKAKSAGEFNNLLAKRCEVRAIAFTKCGGDAPITYLDLAGLGLCRLAEERGMKPSAESPYLPMDLYRAAAK